ncbi:MAG: hypothetical protein FJX61_00990, partial [Alphaproteobacteria bacterium]|nr:hypothetical protein [Alphaproteobacteria bacterium]
MRRAGDWTGLSVVGRRFESNAPDFKTITKQRARPRGRSSHDREQGSVHALERRRHRFAQVGLRQIGPADRRIGQIRAAQVGGLERGPAEQRDRQVAAREVGGREILVLDHQPLAFERIVRAAYHPVDYPPGLEPGLDETLFYDPTGRNTPSAMHLCTVVVDPETGRVGLRDYWTVDDVGRVINPLVV